MSLKYSCYMAGAKPCGYKTQATDENDLRAQLERHLVQVHNVNPPTKTVVNYLVKVAKEQGHLIQM